MKTLRAHDYIGRVPIYEPDFRSLRRIGYGLGIAALMCFLIVCVMIARVLRRTVTAKTAPACMCRGSCMRLASELQPLGNVKGSR